MKKSTVLGIDCGNSSVRVVAGIVTDQSVELDVILQSPNMMTRIGDWYVWDSVYLFREILRGIALAVNKYGTIDSIGVATWGVDFGLFAPEGILLGDVLAYRNEIGASYFDKLSRAEKKAYFRLTGILCDKINSAYLLQGVRDHLPTVYRNATRLLMISDIINYYLTGIMINEPTMLSTSQLFNARTQTVSEEICKLMNLRPELIGPRSVHGQLIGQLRPQIMEELRLTAPIPVISVPSHDTAAAVLAVPAEPGERFAFISSGTWSLLGMELGKARLDESVYRAGFTNEVGAFGTITLLKNSMGLFLLQRLKQEYEFDQVKECSWEDFYALRASRPDGPPLLFDVNDRAFFNPPSMLEAILEAVTGEGESIPPEQKWATAISAAIESLACSYAVGIERLEEATGETVDKIYVVGGGTRDKELNQLTANRTGRPVLLGSAESTSLGNILAQMRFLESFSVEQMRKVIRQSFPPTEVFVQAVKDDAVSRYRSITNK